MEGNTEEESTYLRPEPTEKESGRMERESDGSTTESNNEMFNKFNHMKQINLFVL